MEKRNFTRVPFKANGRVVYQNQIYRLSTMDISLRGAGLTVPSSGVILSEIPLSFTIETDTMSFAGLGRCVFQKDDFWGIKWTELGQNSIDSIMVLLEEYFGDYDQAMKEMNKLVLRVKNG